MSKISYIDAGSNILFTDIKAPVVSLEATISRNGYLSESGRPITHNYNGKIQEPTRFINAIDIDWGEILLADYINEIDVDEATLDLFNTLINDNVDRVVNAAVMLRLLKHGPETFYYNMKVDPSLLFVEALNQKVREFEYDKREYFEDVKKIFLSEIDRIKNDYNFHHKKTL